MTTQELPTEVQNAISKYANLELGGKEVPCPYYINLRGAKDLRVMVGKGTPEEIIYEDKMWEKLKGVDFTKMSASEIKEFLIDRGIGIDCSGFVIHILNNWFEKENRESIWKNLKIPNKSLLAKLSYRLKPVQKLGAEIITNTENSKTIRIKDVLPGDVVRLKWKKKNSHHILLISKVYRNDKGEVKDIEYTHSIPLYGKDSGVKTGRIEVIDQNGKLEKQIWHEKDSEGVNHTLEGYMIQLEDNGLRRVRAMEKIIKKTQA